MRTTLIAALLSVHVLATAVSAKDQRVGDEWTRSVILLEQSMGNGSMGPVGTGFIASYAGRDFLVTNRRTAERRGLIATILLTSRPGTPLRYSLEEVARSTGLPWSVAPDADIAVLPLLLPAEARQFTDSLDVTPLDVTSFKGWEFIREGDDVYVVGFPVFLGAGHYARPVVRSGTVALREREGEFLVDATALPGNSGGPVLLKLYKPDERTGKFATGRASYVVGIASTYIPFQEQAISAQTGRAKTVSEENSGLMVVYSADRIVTLLREYLETHDLESTLQ